MLHVPFCFAPDPHGGTEVYVEALAREQNRLGIATTIAASGEKATRYTHRDIDVVRYPISEALSLEALYGEGDPVAAAGFGNILDEISPDIVHLHAFTSGVSLRTAQEAKKRKIPVVFTYHTPTVSCPRGTLLEMGATVCDGRVEEKRCTRCVLEGRGLSDTMSGILAAIPPGVGAGLGALKLQGGPWTALRMSELIARRNRAFGKMMETVDHIVAVCDWVREVLIGNGVPEYKITVSRQGLAQEPVIAASAQERPTSGGVRIVYLGRIDVTKGIEVLIRALVGVPDAPIVLDVFGVAQGNAGQRLLESLRNLCGSDHRIRFHEPVAPGEIVGLLQNYDALVVPSQCLETGPLVVYEAFGAGIPVVGSNLGGIAELVTHERDGLLVEHSSVNDWSRALRRLVDETSLLPKLRNGIRTPRRMATVAEEMKAVYEKVLVPTPAASF